MNPCKSAAQVQRCTIWHLGFMRHPVFLYSSRVLCRVPPGCFLIRFAFLTRAKCRNCSFESVDFSVIPEVTIANPSLFIFSSLRISQLISASVSCAEPHGTSSRRSRFKRSTSEAPNTRNQNCICVESVPCLFSPASIKGVIPVPSTFRTCRVSFVFSYKRVLISCL